MKPTTIAHEDITQRAREIWERSGRPDGQDTEHWLRAERELRQERERAISQSMQESSSELTAAKTSGVAGAAPAAHQRRKR